MPNHGYNRKDLYANTTSSGGAGPSSRQQQDKFALLSPVTPAVTGINYPSPADASTDNISRKVPRQHLMAAAPSNNNNRLYTLPNSGVSSIEDTAEPPANTVSLDDVWSSIRQAKERKMAKEKPKVQSLEEVAPDVLAINAVLDEPSIRIPVLESHISPPKSIKKQKSISALRESSDGRSLVSTFELPPDMQKQDVHISFQRNRVVVTWESVEHLEWEEDGIVYRERYERSQHRTLPLPEGTRFEEVQAVMNGRRLVLRYPNLRCFRVEPRSKSGDS